MKSCLAVIPARGGSKGLPGKNIRQFAGKPLLAWTIEAAKGSKYISDIVVSTDDTAIKQVAESFGVEVPWLRPQALAQDDTLSIDVLLHAVSQHPQHDTICMLQPTSPLRTAEDINRAFELFNGKNVACVSVTENVFTPYWSFKIVDGHLNFLFPQNEIPMRRQDLIPTYSLNGAIYIANIEWLQKTRSFLSNETIPYLMTAERSYDIDNAEDFEAAEQVMLRLLENK